MTRPILYTLTSSLHEGLVPDVRQEPFIREIEQALGTAFDSRGANFADYGRSDAPELIYVRTGGTEGLFLKKVAPALSAGQSGKHQQPVRLLSSGLSNSLAASMEILSWLRQRGIDGEILHGHPDELAARIHPLLSSSPGAGEADSHPGGPKRDGRGENRALTHPGENGVRDGDASGWIGPYPFGQILEGKRFGVIGRPSDWLISSGVDYAAAKEVLGAELIDIPIEELIAEVRRSPRPETPTIPGNPPANHGGLPENTPISGPYARLKSLNAPRYGRKLDAEDWQGALAVYGALKRLVARYRLDGLTLRCFDLLTALHNTGCLALAILNAEGITATCEGDIPAMLSMAVARARTGGASFQVNLSRIEGDRLLFAHCTVPLTIVNDYCYDTHFESGIGVAIHGELPEGPVTLFKLSPDCSQMLCREARLVANTYSDMLCRTQVVIEAPGAADYFLHTPIGNHHIIVPGKL